MADSNRSSPAKRLKKENNSRQATRKKLKFGRPVHTAHYVIPSEYVQESESDVSSDVAKTGVDVSERTAECAAGSASRFYQKREIKKGYATAKQGKSVSAAAGPSAKQAEKAAKETKSAAAVVREYVSEHAHLLLVCGALLLLVLTIAGAFESCGLLLQGGANVVLGTSYTANEEDIQGVESDYNALEAALQARISNIRSTHPGYDEYNINVDQVGHNPYELASYLTVLFENYSQEEVQQKLQEIFHEQYKLTIRSKTEIRYRMETRTRTRTVERKVKDPDTGEIKTIEVEKEVEYEVEVPYEYKILNVTLENNSLANSSLIDDLNEDQLQRYNVLMETSGNRSELFADNIYASASQNVLHYDIPGEALTDEKFANMIREAEKYLGYPYVWGGASPSTSFDCSGFVSWVINHCGNGWNIGRKTANGLKNLCAVIPRNEAKPGDLIFFQGTYDTAGASHVGIYVGNGMMIHCGNPIQYASINASYWQAHFYCFGRLP